MSLREFLRRDMARRLYVLAVMAVYVFGIYQIYYWKPSLETALVSSALAAATGYVAVRIYRRIWH